MIKLKPLIISILISLATGTIAGLITSSSQNTYSTIDTPFFAPPSFLFPIVWSILYLLMGISSYIIYTSNAKPSDKQAALTIYALSLVINFIWPILFFNSRLYLVSFIWLVALWIFILLTILAYSKISKVAAYLQIPYLLWVTFAGILNLAIVILN